MKKHTITIALIFFCFSLHAQHSKDFYYYQGEKIYLTERSDKIFIKLWKDADKESLFSLMTVNFLFGIAASILEWQLALLVDKIDDSTHIELIITMNQ